MNAASLCTGLGFGAGLMYFLDPQQGRRRRKLLLDQAYSTSCHLNEGVEVGWRDLSNRTYGMYAELRSTMSPHDNSDQVVEARVRSKLGRNVSHPSAIVVSVDGDRVTLSGPILASEVQSLIQSVRRVVGVRHVENRLDVHQTADISALQGGKTAVGELPELFQSRWSPGMRMVMGAIGGALMLSSVGSRRPTNLACGVMGMGLVACSLQRSTSQRHEYFTQNQNNRSSSREANIGTGTESRSTPNSTEEAPIGG
jgi:hypothetical protein